ncbi:MAG: glycosyltransferase family 2 protein [Sulfurovaceae bacterium]|nr:glycosyltransferase family 2 protein [Sulfurovaceae bacterium]
MNKKNTIIKIAITVTVRAEIGIIQYFINYHLNIGIDHIFIFFDDPNDNSFDYFRHINNISCIRCDTVHWAKLACDENSNIEARQINNANMALALAKNRGIDWIAHIDIDELIYTNIPLKKILNTLPKNTNYLWLPPLEAIPNKIKHSAPFKEIHAFKQLPTKQHQYYRGMCEAAYFAGEYFRGHIGGKSITKISNKINSLNLHKPSADEKSLRVSTLDVACLLHYDCFDYDAWLTKWTRRIDGTAIAGGRKNRMLQLSYFEEAYNKNDLNLKNLYKQLYFLSRKTRKELIKNNMLINIYINKSLFAKKPSKFNYFFHAIINIFKK